jgi:hypothetical protein
MRNAVFKGYCTNRTGIWFRVQIPAIIYIVVGYATSEYIAWTSGQLTGKPIRIFVGNILVVI